ncbi:MAG TPA: HAMP domain-containing sensor histidine kinase [Puia sp.]|nr:HAMP domain-containing sensor histidine kinase [Puia sp.]
MRLFTKYSRVSIMASVLALLLGSVGYFFAVRFVLVHELDDAIRIEEEEILDNVARHGHLPKPANYRDQQIAYVPAQQPEQPRWVNTTWGYLESQLTNAINLGDTTEEPEANSRPRGRHARKRDPDDPCRALIFPVRVGNQYYTAYVSKSEEETEDLLVVIMFLTAGMILLMLGILFLANRLLLRRIWQPFYRTLEGIRAFNLSSRQQLSPAESTDIEEFRRLDEAARQMTGQISRDYEMLKNFTENASHEMQTPLAIINSKLDLLIQDPRMREEHHQPVQAMYDAISRLRQLNASLLLLTKIENNQFAQTESLDLAPLIEQKLAQLEDPLKARQLEVHRELTGVRVAINNYLADILLNNLLINAIRHNKTAGKVDIRLAERSLRISNSGPAPSFDPKTIFDRFVKGPNSGGTGLGLAIVRQICDNYNFSVGYSYAGEMHTVEVIFPG